jgi:nitric oxide dioxygenase
MAAVEEVLGPAMTPAVGVGWSEAILFLSGMLIEREEALYNEAKARNGGWRGFRRFLVARREIVARDVVEFTFRPADARGVYFDFSPGQFVSVKVDPDGYGLTSPRHYTVTSSPGLPYLQICVKRIKNGKVSNFLIDKCTDGQEVFVSPPFGTFTSKLAERQGSGDNSSVALLSAGIGITPMLALLPELRNRVVIAAHVDRSEETFPHHKRFMQAGTQCITETKVHYTGTSGRLTKEFAASLVARAGPKHDWYICGPSSFMVGAMRSLTAAGVDATRIHFEVFGPQLCPAHDSDD